MRLPVIKIKNGSEKLSSHSGLILIGRLLASLDLEKHLSEIPGARCTDPDFSNADIISAMAGLIAIGKPDYDAIEYFRKDPVFLIESLGLSGCPSSPTLRQRLNHIGRAADAILKERNAALVRMKAPKLTSIKTGCGNFLPLDIDVSPFDNSNTKKEGVSWTYKKLAGFAPILAYLGREGYLVNLELREGRQHCQNGTPDFLKETLGIVRQITRDSILVRMDSGNDSQDNLDLFRESSNTEFIVKRNLRRESCQAWADFARKNGRISHQSPGKIVYVGKTSTGLQGEALPYPITFEVTEIWEKKGQKFMFPEIVADTWWCSLSGIDPEEVIELYNDHGTSEQFHSELKTDMDLERLPSQSFSTNSLVLILGMLAYNMLRIIGQYSLDTMKDENVGPMPRHRLKSVQRRRIRTVMQDLIYMAGRLIYTGRKTFLSFGCINPVSCLMPGILNRIEHLRSMG